MQTTTIETNDTTSAAATTADPELEQAEARYRECIGRSTAAMAAHAEATRAAMKNPDDKALRAKQEEARRERDFRRDAVAVAAEDLEALKIARQNAQQEAKREAFEEAKAAAMPREALAAFVQRLAPTLFEALAQVLSQVNAQVDEMVHDAVIARHRALDLGTELGEAVFAGGHPTIPVLGAEIVHVALRDALTEMCRERGVEINVPMWLARITPSQPLTP